MSVFPSRMQDILCRFFQSDMIKTMSDETQQDRARNNMIGLHAAVLKMIIMQLYGTHLYKE